MVQNNKPHVSVIIPAFNAENTIGAAIESILNQSYENIEIVVVDDGSIDNTHKIIQRFPTVKYVYQDNSGPWEARNTGIINSSGEYIAYQDADDISYENRIEKEMDELIKNNIDMVYSGVIVVDEKNITIPHTPEFNKYLLLEKNFITCGTVLHKRQCLDVVGMWNENIDWDLWIRIAEHFKIGYVNDRLYEYTSNKGISSKRSLLENREIDLYTFSNKFERTGEKWIQFKINRIACECLIIEYFKISINKQIKILIISNVVFTFIERVMRFTTHLSSKIKDMCG